MRKGSASVEIEKAGRTLPFLDILSGLLRLGLLAFGLLARGLLARGLLARRLLAVFLVHLAGLGLLVLLVLRDRGHARGGEHGRNQHRNELLHSHPLL